MSSDREVRLSYEKYDSLVTSDREVTLQKGVTLQTGGKEALTSVWKEEEDKVCFDQVHVTRLPYSIKSR